MRDHAIQALVGAGGGNHDHLALGLGQSAVLFHQRIVIGKERPKFVRAICQRQEHVGYEAGFLLHREQAGADIVRQLVDGRRREALCNGLRHGAGSGSSRVMR